MVWIHGGAFVGGNGSSVNAGGAYFLDKDVVLVSLNYRLGVFGFFSTGDSAAPGNFGLKDQVLALKWVQNNIKAFGGDPKKVTIFGQSAGGVSVSLHAISNASKGKRSTIISEKNFNNTHFLLSINDCYIFLRPLSSIYHSERKSIMSLGLSKKK